MKIPYVFDVHADAAALNASRERYRAALDAGLKLSEIAARSVGFVRTPEGRAAQRALRLETFNHRLLRALRRAAKKVDDD